MKKAPFFSGAFRRSLFRGDFRRFFLRFFLFGKDLRANEEAKEGGEASDQQAEAYVGEEMGAGEDPCESDDKRIKKTAAEERQFRVRERLFHDLRKQTKQDSKARGSGMAGWPGLEIIVLWILKPSEIPPILEIVGGFFPNAAKLVEETPSGTSADPFKEMHQSPLEKHRQYEDAADSEHDVGFFLSFIEDQEDDGVNGNEDDEGNQIGKEGISDQETIDDDFGTGVIVEGIAEHVGHDRGARDEDHPSGDLQPKGFSPPKSHPDQQSADRTHGISKGFAERLDEFPEPIVRIGDRIREALIEERPKENADDRDGENDQKPVERNT